MKKYLFTSLFLIFLINSNAQYKAGIFMSQNFTSFRFIDSNQEVSNPGFSVRYGYGFSVQKDLGNSFYTEGSLTYNNVGASSDYYSSKLDWSFQYLNLTMEGGYRFNRGRFRPIAGGGLYYGRLVKADQIIGSLSYNLMSGNRIKKNDFGPAIFAGIEYKYSNKFLENGVVYARVNGMYGLLNLEDYKTAYQKMFNRIISIQAGILFSFRL